MEIHVVLCASHKCIWNMDCTQPLWCSVILFMLPHGPNSLDFNGCWYHTLNTGISGSSYWWKTCTSSSFKGRQFPCTIIASLELLEYYSSFAKEWCFGLHAVNLSTYLSSIILCILRLSIWKCHVDLSQNTLIPIILLWFVDILL